MAFSAKKIPNLPTLQVCTLYVVYDTMLDLIPSKRNPVKRLDQLSTKQGEMFLEGS